MRAPGGAVSAQNSLGSVPFVIHCGVFFSKRDYLLLNFEYFLFSLAHTLSESEQLSVKIS